MTKIKTTLAILALAIILSLVWFQQEAKSQIEDVTNLTGLHIQATAIGTATPLLMVRNNGVGNAFEIRNTSGTPVYQVSNAGAVTQNSVFDLNGIADALVLDADGDTTLSAPTDDQIDVEINGADDFAFKANSFELASGSIVDLNGAADALVLDADGNTSIASDTGDQVDIEVGGSNVVSITTTALGVTGDISVGDDLTVGDDATVTGFVVLPDQDLVVAAGFIITPTASYISITSTGEVTSSTTIPVEETGISEGTVIIIRNGNASDPINIDGTGGSVECKANVALGADDTLTLIYNGAEWNCISSYDNS